MATLKLGPRSIPILDDRIQADGARNGKRRCGVGIVQQIGSVQSHELLDNDDDGEGEKVEGFDGGGDSDDSDDLVVVVDEVCGNRKQSVKKALSGGESDDDDCVVLDGDPDKPRGVEKEKENEKGGFEDGSGDDLVVVSCAWVGRLFDLINLWKKK